MTKQKNKQPIEELLKYQVDFGSNNISYIESLMIDAVKEIKKLRKELLKIQRKTEVKMGD
jgi:hypothetical protein